MQRLARWFPEEFFFIVFFYFIFFFTLSWPDMRLIYLSGFLFIVSVFMVCGFFREFRPFIGAKLAKKNNEKKNKFFVEEITLASGEGFFVRFFFRCTRNLRCRFDDFHRSWYCFLFFGEGVGLIKMAVSMQSSSNFGRYISLFFFTGYPLGWIIPEFFLC